MSNQKPEKARWKWEYTLLTGIMYGPIPVGFIIIIIFMFIYYAFLR